MSDRINKLNDMMNQFKKNPNKCNTKKKKVTCSKKVQEQKQITFTKGVVIAVLILAELQICASYVLAFLDKTEIAQQLSIQTTVTIVGVVLGYFLKALFENLSKNGIFDQDTQIIDKLIDNSNCGCGDEQDIAG